MSGPRSATKIPDHIDFLARLSDAWDGRGAQVFKPGGTEHRALWTLARLPPRPEVERIAWMSLSAEQRSKLLFAARDAIDLGRACAWVFGEGRGA